MPFSKIKPASSVTVDYVKEKDGRFVVSNIVVTVKSQRVARKCHFAPMSADERIQD